MNVIERTAARAHRQPVDRGKPHCAGGAATGLDRAHRRSVAEMRDHDVTAGKHHKIVHAWRDKATALLAALDKAREGEW